MKRHVMLSPAQSHTHKLQQIPSFGGSIWQTEHCACESKCQGYPCKILAGGRHAG